MNLSVRLEDMLLTASLAGFDQDERHILAEIYRESLRSDYSVRSLDGKGYSTTQKLDLVDSFRCKAYNLCLQEMDNLINKRERRQNQADGGE